MARILAFVDHVYEDLELWVPKMRLEEDDHQVVVAGPSAGETYRGKHGYPCVSDAALADMAESDFDALLIPGGFAPDKLRRRPDVLNLTRAFDAKQKPIAFICHGGWIPVSAKILSGKRATGSLGIKDDLENAGAIWVDEALVEDGHLISSRTPPDLPVFSRALADRLR